MPNTPESPQIKILHSIYSHGGVNVITSDIVNDCGMDANNVHACGRHLVTRFIVIKKTIKEGGQKSYWTIRPNSMDKAKRMLKEAYGTEF